MPRSTEIKRPRVPNGNASLFPLQYTIVYPRQMFPSFFLLNFFTNTHTCKRMLRKRFKSMQGKNCLFPSFTTSLCSEKLTGTKVNFLRGFIIKN